MQTLTRIALVCLALAIAGCAGAVSGGDAGRRPAADSPAAAAFQLPEARAGQLSLQDGRLRFIACGESGPGRNVADLDDGRGSRLVRELGHTAEGIPVLVRLSGAQLTEIRYAAPEGAGCKRLSGRYLLEARGNEPFWSLRVGHETATFTTPELPDGREYRNGTWQRTGPHSWLYRAQGEEKGAFLSLELDGTGCTDSMSGARFPFRALVHRNGRRLEGCALEGTAAYPGHE